MDNFILFSHTHTHRVEFDPQEAALIQETILLTIGTWSHVLGCISIIGNIIRCTLVVFLTRFIEYDFLAAIQV